VSSSKGRRKFRELVSVKRENKKDAGLRAGQCAQTPLIVHMKSQIEDEQRTERISVSKMWKDDRDYAPERGYATSP